MAPHLEHNSPSPEYSMDGTESSAQARTSSHLRSADNFEDLSGAVRPSAVAPEDNAEPTQNLGVAPGDGGHPSKKRKGSDGDEMTNDWHGNYLRKETANLRLRNDNLRLRVILNERDDTISRLKLSNKESKIEHHREQARLREDLNKAVATYVKSGKKLKDEILRIKINDNSLKQTVNKRDVRILELEHLSRTYTRAPVKHHEPTLIPDLNRSVRDHPEYKHPEAPREHKTYTWFESDMTYPPGTGKVRVTKYGSTKFWDLGLCRAHFEFGHVCLVRECEYRHDPLTMGEQIYIRFLEPKGPEFLQLVATENVRRRQKVLL